MFPGAGQIAAAVLPTAMNAAGQFLGVGTGNIAGRAASAGMNSDQVFDYLQKQGIQLDPAQQQRLMNESAREAGQDTLNQTMQGQAFMGQLGNQIANLNAERGMALNAQQNAANNVANQLVGLNQARNANAQAITNAMSTVGGMFR
jgi:hypothetical protein